MPVRQRRKTANVPDGVPRKGKGKKEETWTSYVMTELRDFVLLVSALAIALFIYGVCYAYFWHGPPGEREDKRLFPVNGPSLVTCDSCSRETVGHLSVITGGDRDGAMLIFLHGFPETAQLAWHNQIDYFARMGYFVVAPDQRGYNTSAKFDSTMDYHLDNLAQDVIGLIDHYGRDTASVVGHDWGAAVTWHLGQFHPERLEKMVVINVPHPQVMSDTLRSSWEQIKNSWYIFFFQLPVLPEWKIEKNNFDWLVNALAQSPIGTYSKSTVELYKKAWAKEGAAGGMVSWYRAAVRGGFMGRAGTKRVEDVPTLMIWGDQDTALKASMAQPSIEMCDQGKLVVLEGVSHWVPNEAPQKVNSLINDFLI